MLSLGPTLVFVLVPELNDVFSLTETLPYFGWLMALGAAIIITVVDEVVKYRIRMRVELKSSVALACRHAQHGADRASSS